MVLNGYEALPTLFDCFSDIHACWEEEILPKIEKSFCAYLCQEKFWVNTRPALLPLLLWLSRGTVWIWGFKGLIYIFEDIALFTPYVPPPDSEHLTANYKLRFRAFNRNIDMT